MVEVMKAVRLLALALLWSGAAAPLTRGQGPVTTGSETVAKKKNPSSATPDADKNSGGTIPSEFKVNKNNPQPAATFHTDALTVAVDVAVLDSNGHFIPKIPQGNFRILEDNQPQKITGFSMGEAPMTITMVIEFSNRFESFYSAAWFQVLNAAYGFLQTLKPEDYVAVVAYDLRPEILRFLHQPAGHLRGDAAAPRRRFFRGESVRRPHRHRNPHAGYRGAKGGAAAFQRHRHVQQDHL